MAEDKLQKELKRLEKTVEEDLSDIKNFQATQKEKYKIAALRKYGPLPDILSSPLRKEFKAAFEKGDYRRCQEIIYQLNFRRASNLKNMNKAILAQLEEKFLFAAQKAGLRIDVLAQSFKQEYENLTVPKELDIFGEEEAKRQIKFLGKTK